MYRGWLLVVGMLCFSMVLFKAVVMTFPGKWEFLNLCMILSFSVLKDVWVLQMMNDLVKIDIGRLSFKCLGCEER